MRGLGVKYTCQLSRLQAENFNLAQTHAFGPNSHAWMKNVSYNSLNWNTFLKDVNLHQFEKRTLHVIEKVNEYRTALNQNRSEFGALKRSIESFSLSLQNCSERLRTSSEVFRKLRICLCRLQKSWCSPVKNLTPLTQKKFAGILKANAKTAFQTKHLCAQCRNWLTYGALT